MRGPARRGAMGEQRSAGRATGRAGSDRLTSPAGPGLARRAPWTTPALRGFRDPQRLPTLPASRLGRSRAGPGQGTRKP
jgi:hypothetical protein